MAASIAHKHKHTTGGLDGVSLQDLKAMPPAALDNFLAMFHMFYLCNHRFQDDIDVLCLTIFQILENGKLCDL